MKTGLVLEGGSFRGIFTAGVLDYFIENQITFPYVIGVSAGAGNAMNYIAGQKGRTQKVIMHENADAYYGLGQLRKSGRLLDLDKMMYEYSYDQIPFDFKAFFDAKVESEFVVANCQTSKAEYMKPDGTEKNLLDICKASCSVPMICNPVEIGENVYLDGSTLDSVPFERALRSCDKAVVILTRKQDEKPTDYSRMKSLLNICYHYRYPEYVDQLVLRKQRYEEQMSLLSRYESEGKVFVIRPEICSIGHFENSVEKINQFYQHGYELMEKRATALKDFLNEQ